MDLTPRFYTITYRIPESCDATGSQDYYGWDFVNQDNDPYDDYGHGTIIGSYIFNTLHERGIDFQLLPIKAFDGNGNGNYFDILCGFKYALNNPDVDVINMSFGWYWQDYEIFSRYMDQSQNRVVIATSAGNDRLNTDQEVHYPSAYPYQNIVASAALGNSTNGVNLASFSNYGTNSVDIAAPGQDLPFYLDSTNYILVSGTSYSNAYVSAHAGITYNPSNNVIQHIQTMIQEAYYHPNLGNIQYSAYIYY